MLPWRTSSEVQLLSFWLCGGHIDCFGKFYCVHYCVSPLVSIADNIGYTGWLGMVGTVSVLQTLTEFPFSCAQWMFLTKAT